MFSRSTSKLFFINFAIIFLLQGCTGQDFASQGGSVSPCNEQLLKQTMVNDRLLQEQKNLQERLQRQLQWSADLQLTLLKRQDTITSLRHNNEKLIKELVLRNTKAASHISKAETVSLLAEVTSLLKTAMDALPELSSSGAAKLAETYLTQGQQALASGHYEEASTFAGQALTELQALAYESSDLSENRWDKEIIFIEPLPMKVTENSNFRVSPSLDAPVQGILLENAQVSALSARGTWIRAVNDCGNEGWIHYSLLRGTYD